jgi:hypothetical protein
MARVGRPAKRLAQFVEYVENVIDRDGVAPSYGMACVDLRIGTRGEVRRLVCVAEKQGLLRRVGAGRVRRIRLVGLES